MKRMLFTLVLAAMAAPVIADVGISVNVSQPGFYGQINIGSVPQPPQLIYAQPVLVQEDPVYVGFGPMYLHVPPGHEKHWAKHCAEYNACGRPVYFVRDDWYNREYAPRQQHGEGQGKGRGHGHGHGEGHEHGRGHDD